MTDQPDPLVQMNVRVPQSLRDDIDARRAAVTDAKTGREGISRDRWVANAIRYAMSTRPPARTLSNTVGRTAPPPHRRSQ